MTDDRSQDERPVDLSALPSEVAPPAALESRTVAALHQTGLLKDSRASGSRGGRWMMAAVIAVVSFVGGVVTRGATTSAPPSPTFALLLYENRGGVDSTAHERRAAEYTAWAQMRHADGRVVGGEALGPKGIALFREDTTAFAGVVASPATDTSQQLVGFFLVIAANQGAALRLAHDCPHLKYGGQVVVRPILPT